MQEFYYENKDLWVFCIEPFQLRISLIASLKVKIFASVKHTHTHTCVMDANRNCAEQRCEFM